MKKTAIVIFFISLCHPALASNWQITPGVSVKEEYNDNIDVSFVDPVDDLISTITPQLSIDRKSERLTTSLNGALNWITYRDDSDRDNLDQSVNGAIQFQVSPRSSVSGSLNYSLDSRPDRDIDETGVIQTSDERERFSFSAGFNHRITEILDSNVSFSTSREEYDSPSSTNPMSYTMGLGFGYNMYRFIPRSRISLNASYSRDDDDDSNSDTFRGTIGLNKQLTELLSLSMNGGMRYTHTSTDIVRFNPYLVPFFFPDQITTEETGFVGGATLDYRFWRGNLSLGYSQDVQAVSGQSGLSDVKQLFGSVSYNLEKGSCSLSYSQGLKSYSERLGTTDTKRLSTSINHRFTQRLSASMSASYTVNESTDDSQTTDDEETISISPRVSYQLNRYIAASTSYRHVLARKTNTDDTANQNVFYFQISGNYPILEN